MSVGSFLDAVEILYENKKYEEALCMACITIDACSAKEYPDRGDRSNAKRYKLFLKRHFSTVCKYGFPGIQTTNIRIKINVPDSNLKPDENGYVDMEPCVMLWPGS